MKTALSHQVLARKWRPRQFSQVVGQEHVVKALTNALNQNYLHHAYLFTGTRGVGKTTIARILAKCLNCETKISAEACNTCSNCVEIDSGRFIDLIEVDAASRTKVEDTRELLDNVQYLPTKGRFKVYLIDEVHMLSGHSFNALLKTLEEPPPHVKFLLATTDPQRLPATVLSRCLQFHLLPMPHEQINTHLQQILKEETVEFDTTATQLLAKSADGSMRDALSLLDQAIAFGNGHVKAAEVKQMLGTIDDQHLLGLIQALAQRDINLLLEYIKALADLGTDFKQALAELLELIHQLAILQFAPNYAEANPRLQDFIKTFSANELQLFYQIVLMGQNDLNLAPSPRIGFEMCLLRLFAFEPQSNHNPNTETVATAPKTNIPSSKPIAARTPEQNDWSSLLKTLKLTGPTLALAQHCALKSMNESKLELLLDPKHALLRNPKHDQRIAEALKQYFDRPMSVSIELASDSLSTTPAVIKQAQDQAKQNAAEQAIHSNQKIQAMIEAFDATVVKDSIMPNDVN
ncbi:MAG TPA: DNA polymerase III subunit gamma/tau [Coxiellaceae bacterium]|nr:DNA polymerase III subunit gamma/tau [Coxiellaceae bacterium]